MKDKKVTILLVDDDPELIWILTEALTKEGYRVLSAEDGKTAIQQVRNEAPDLVLMDINMPDINGIELLGRIKAISRRISAVMLSAYGEAKNVVKAMHAGADDFITKPFDIDELKITISKVLERKALACENESLKKKLKSRAEYENFIGDSNPILNIKKMIEQVADTELTILVRGESGTGKELVTRAIHSLSNRRDKPFIKVNCATLPETLLESELFGYERGAFTGAQRPKPGRFEFANEGTIFLDEIGEMPPSLQAKLLQVLEEKEFSRLGGKKSVKVDVRIIVATNRDLEEGIRNGSFREDLFYRLNEVTIFLPPLREHKEDIYLLVDYFLKKYSAMYGKEITSISPQIMNIFMNYDWPGNIRELENLIKKIIVLGSEEVVYTVIPHDVVEGKMVYKNTKIIPLKEVSRLAIQKAEKATIKSVLAKTNWNRIQAAKLLQVSYRSLLSKIKEYQIRE
ncbi:MAG: sigma-54 dependent transcriptional regulator [bacterium]|nr:sigma-54 dependent transcriptional regulator [bacterium]